HFLDAGLRLGGQVAADDVEEAHRAAAVHRDRELDVAAREPLLRHPARAARQPRAVDPGQQLLAALGDATGRRDLGRDLELGGRALDVDPAGVAEPARAVRSLDGVTARRDADPQRREAELDAV